MGWEDLNLIKVLKDGGVAVMPTDTIYGIVGRAENPLVVNRIYEIRKRNPAKPCIILFGDLEDLERFFVSLNEEQKEVLRDMWKRSGPTSVILDCMDEGFAYLHRGTRTLAFRFPKNEDLKKLLQQTGPLIAPSANPEGLTPAKNIAEARKYFGDEVDIYADGGELAGKASKIIRLHKDGSVTIIRE